MRCIFSRLVKSIYNPAKVYTDIIDKPSIKETIVIICVLFTSSFIRPMTDAYTQYMDQPMITYLIAILIIVTLYLSCALAFIIEVLYLKLVLHILGIKEKLTKIGTLLAYTMAPSIIYNIIVDIFPTLLVTTTTNGKFKVLYSKLCLGYIIYGLNDQHPMIYNMFKSLNIFTIWTNVLGIIALSILCNISYSKAAMIFIPYWLLSAIIPMVFLL